MGASPGARAAPSPDEIAALRVRVAALESATRQGAARLAVLGELTYGLGSVQDVQEACDTAVRLLQRLLPSVSSLAVYLIDEGTKVLERRAAWGPSAWQDEGSVVISVGRDTLMSRAIRYNRAQIGYGAACIDHPPPAETAPPAAEAVCCALVPMRAGATIVGLLRVGALAGQGFTDDDLAFLHIAAAQVATEVHALQRRAFLQEVVDQSPAGLVVVEAPHGHVVLANRAAHDLWGRHLAPAVQDGVACSLLRAADLGLPPLQQALATGAAVPGEECAITRADGSQVPVLVSAAGLEDRHGSARYVACTVQDMSAVKRVEALKDEFLSSIAHELRTPLTAAKGFVQLGLRRLERVDLGQIRRTFSAADVALGDLAALVEELLEFSRLQADRFEINPEPLELRDLVERQLRQLRGLSERHTIDGRLPALPVLVEADYRRLMQVVGNLVSNAIKYSPGGGTVEVVLATRDDEACLSVADQGIGIPTGDLDRIFAPYYRARNTRRRNLGGLGMGLYISRSIVERHGGRIWVESVEGQGATVSFSLPLLPARPGS